MVYFNRFSRLKLQKHWLEWKKILSFEKNIENMITATSCFHSTEQPCCVDISIKMEFSWKIKNKKIFSIKERERWRGWLPTTGSCWRWPWLWCAFSEVSIYLCPQLGPLALAISAVILKKSLLKKNLWLLILSGTFNSFEKNTDIGCFFIRMLFRQLFLCTCN